MSEAAAEQGWVPTDDTFGARLAMVRQAMGWGNVREAARECRIPVESWRGWERDNREPRNLIEMVDRIAERTGCDPLWLEGRVAWRRPPVGVPAVADRRMSNKLPTMPYVLLPCATAA